MKYIILYPISRLYLVIITIYNLLYKYRILKPVKFSVPLISIGNIAVGGAGKTPITICLSQLLNKHCIKHVIISRGYKKQSHGTVLVSDGKTPVSDLVASAYESGDEAYLMASKLPKTPIVVDNNKINAIKYAIQKFNPEIVLIDDGFQSQYLNINHNIVLHNGSMLNAELQMFPIGKLRQPLSELKRADIIIVTKTHQKSEHQFLNQYQNIIIYSKSTTSILSWDNTNQTLIKKISQEINHNKIFIFCGLADPISFFQSSKKHYSNLYIKKTYSDHFQYQNNDKFLEHCTLAQQKKINTFVTSYKDFVKLQNDNNFMSINIKWEIVDIEYSVPDSILKNFALNKTKKNL